MRTRKEDADGTAAAMERIAREREEMANARKRLIGSYGLGTVALWRMSTVDEPAMWILLAVLAFGLANVDQILKAMGKG